MSKSSRVLVVQKLSCPCPKRGVLHCKWHNLFPNERSSCKIFMPASYG
jgi:hypothetical protein